ncbi:MAG: hypothetical protein ABH956_02445 [Candidatus Nealsonbacteria bacterium]
MVAFTAEGLEFCKLLTRYDVEEIRFNIFENQTEISGNDLYWVIARSKGSKTTYITLDGKKIIVFSTKELAEKFIQENEYFGHFARPFAWNKLVDKFVDVCELAILCEFGCYSFVPLERIK